jgi:hypothetical protein
MKKLVEKTVPVKSIYEMTEEELEKEYQEFSKFSKESREFVESMREKYLNATK